MLDEGSVEFIPQNVFFFPVREIRLIVCYYISEVLFSLGFFYFLSAAFRLFTPLKRETFG